jgi:glycosyltransferase involved in cell wall biosynthesis
MPHQSKKIYFTVTNDLYYDQRMGKICTSLAENGFEPVLVGRKLPSSPALNNVRYRQRRLHCWFVKGKLFYAEYNIRLFFFLLFKKMNAICAIDLDTILPCLFISKLKKIPRVYDAHELFTELKEVVTNPFVKKIWTKIERYSVPRFKNGYTVSESIAEELHKRYGVNYEVIRNVTILKPIEPKPDKGKFILYQGAVNEARGLESLIPAMKKINHKLIICGDGNFMVQLKKLILENDVAEKVELKGMLPPDQLWEISQTAWIGITLAENTGLNQYFSLANKFFDYMHTCLPQVAMNFPEYRKINEQFKIAVLIDDILPETITDALNNLLSNDVLYHEMKENCRKAREIFNWQHEKDKLVSFYKTLPG